ncbi:VanZ family protein [Saccharopolyspora hirsuta]|uniref:VanZ family protein n=1 Tax=Saccharopolyspora hirsuta TaxID=1837 RepID=A0A5M7BH62_SACHI|nr:VanZ family protein [Saccharopolyspora hirsuta]KAA5827134.1 VanZ family protein [Saccharopolyspora hirsuta]
MDQLPAIVDGILPVVCAPVPLAVLTTAVSLVLRTFVGSRSQPRDPFVDAALVYSAVLIGGIVFAPQSGTGSRIELQPGADVLVALRAEPGDLLPWLQLTGNLLLLLPFGVLAPMRVRWLSRTPKVFLAALAVSAGIELTQLLLVSGRVTSTDDVLLNALGAAAGSALTRRWRRVPRAQHHADDGGYPVRWIIAEVERQRRSPARRR